MTPFLQQVAQHYTGKNISAYCFIFPSRRALLFFKKYLHEEIEKAKFGVPVPAPKMYTINDFFFTLAGVNASDRVSLLLELYECYTKLYKNPEPLDEFIYWGDILLSDFNDVDKYLSDAKALFANIADFKNIRDTYSYLSRGQLEAINKFAAHFKTDFSEDPKRKKSKVKERFIQLWDILYPLYLRFNEKLKAQGLAYEGQVYRGIAEAFRKSPAIDILESVFPQDAIPTEKYVFVGLNALNECEKTVMSKMQDADLAEFCWDYCSEWIKDSNNKSSFFLKDNIIRFPQAFEPQVPEEKTDFSVLNIASGIGQVKQLPQILERTGGKGMETAVILPDEGLLMPVLNTIPPHIQDINVTMGYSMRESELFTFMNEVAALQMHIRVKDGEEYFYHKQVSGILGSSIFNACASEEEKNRNSDILKKPSFYIPARILQSSPIAEKIFTATVTDLKSPDAKQIHAIEDYQMNIIAALAPRLKASGSMSTELEFAKEYYLAISRLRRKELPILPATYLSLLSRMVGGVSVPFRGEPLNGLQIMGPLETRALDFDNLIILSCNEGVFPRKSVSASFIPHELRKGFSLPTYEFQDAIWAYYFYRMIQRAKHVWMLCDTRPDATRAGEESRYIKQLEKYCNAPVTRHTAKTAIGKGSELEDIPKTAEDIEILRGGELSASVINRYLECPVKLYFQKIKGLKAVDELSESLDSRTVGNVFHDIMNQLYETEDGKVSAAYIKSIIHDPKGLDKRIEEQIEKELNCFEVVGRNLIYKRIVHKYILNTLREDLRLMEEYKVDSFLMLSHETAEHITIGGFKFIGFIDRKDSFRAGEIRVVDYKTGKVDKNEKTINDENAESVAQASFVRGAKKHLKIPLQMYIYDKIVQEKNKGADIINAVYSMRDMGKGSAAIYPLNQKFVSLMDAKMQETLAEIADTSIPFKHCEDKSVCQTCDFKNICGR